MDIPDRIQRLRLREALSEKLGLLSRASQVSTEASRRLRSFAVVFALAFVAHRLSTQQESQRQGERIQQALALLETRLQVSGRTKLAEAIQIEALALDGPWESRGDVRRFGQTQFWIRNLGSGKDSPTRSLLAWTVPGGIQIWAAPGVAVQAMKRRSEYRPWRLVGVGWEGLEVLVQALQNDSNSAKNAPKKAVKLRKPDPYQIQFDKARAPGVKLPP